MQGPQAIIDIEILPTVRPRLRCLYIGVDNEFGRDGRESLQFTFT